jgi:hypothetical protein
MFGYGLALLGDVSLLLGWCNYDFSPNTRAEVFIVFFVAGSNETIRFCCDKISFKISNNNISISSLCFHAFSSDPRFPFSFSTMIHNVQLSHLAPHIYSRRHKVTPFFIKILSHVIELKLKNINKSDRS